MNPELSILIPCYNYDAFPLVENLHRQGESMAITFEILVFDDGSNEGRERNEKINQLKHASYVYHPENKGRAALRQQLLNSSSYELLLLMDVDVMPVSSDFLSLYFKNLNGDVDLIFGGIAYSEVSAEKTKMLRYAYGKKREATTAAQRKKNPYFIASANLLIRKSMLKRINTSQENFYGSDLLLSQNLMKYEARIKHIDNPVFHLGIETSQDYLKKSKEVVQNLIKLEQNGQLTEDFTRLQQVYIKLKRIGLLPLLNACTGLFVNAIERNLISSRPKLVLLDLYKLKYYSDLKKNG